MKSDFEKFLSGSLLLSSFDNSMEPKKVCPKSSPYYEIYNHFS